MSYFVQKREASKQGSHVLLFSDLYMVQLWGFALISAGEAAAASIICDLPLLWLHDLTSFVSCADWVHYTSLQATFLLNQQGMIKHCLRR